MQAEYPRPPAPFATLVRTRLGQVLIKQHLAHVSAIVPGLTKTTVPLRYNSGLGERWTGDWPLGRMSHKQAYRSDVAVTSKSEATSSSA